MKKKFVLCLILLCSSSLFGFEWKSVNLEIQPTYTLENGVYNEFVYQYDNDGNEQKLSELNWNLKNISNFGTAITIGYKYINLSGDFSISIPKRSGFMFDSDWQDTSDYSKKTNYSISENTLLTNYKTNVFLSGNFKLSNDFSFLPYLNFCYTYTSFSGNNAYGWYGDSSYPMVAWDSPEAIYYEKGILCGIDYSRANYYFNLGTKYECKPIQSVSLAFDLGITIYSLTKSIDTHFSNHTKTEGNSYYDVMSGWLTGCKLGLDGTFSFNKHFIAGINYNLFLQGQISGITASTSYPGNTYILNTAVFSKASSLINNFSIYCIIKK